MHTKSSIFFANSSDRDSVNKQHNDTKIHEIVRVFMVSLYVRWALYHIYTGGLYNAFTLSREGSHLSVFVGDERAESFSAGDGRVETTGKGPAARVPSTVEHYMKSTVDSSSMVPYQPHVQDQREPRWRSACIQEQLLHSWSAR